MIISNELFVRLLILALGICGFFLARYIHNHKTKDTPMVCPVNFDCHTVVHSDYSRFLGIPVEFLGMIYYALVAVTYFIALVAPQFLPLDNYLFVIGLFSTSFAAFLFSAYLIGIQIFILKKGCSWCIVSAFICLFIFLLTIFGYDLGFVISNITG